MSENNPKEEKTVNNIIIIGIILTIIFLTITVITGINIQKNQTCGAKIITDYTFTPTTNSPYTLNNENKSILQPFNIPDEDIIGYELCYEINITSNKGEQITTTDETLQTLGTSYITNTTTNQCTNINPELITTKTKYIGIKCPTCDATHNITIKQEALGTEVIQIEKDTTTNIYKDQTLNYQLAIKTSCKENIKFYYLLYITAIAMLGLSMLIIIGYKKFSDILFKNW